MNQSAVTIIIVTYNAEPYIENCINSLLVQTYPNFNILIIDNNSSDKTRKLIRRYTKSNGKIVLIEKNKNYGFARGNNIGMRYALANFQTDYFFLLNQDTVVQDDLLDKLLCWSRKKGTAVLGPKILIKKNKAIWWVGTKIFSITDLFKTPRLALSCHIDKERNASLFADSPVEVEAIVGCALFLPKEIVRKVGLFDEIFFMYGEDLDYSLRIRKKGYKLFMIPEAVVYHDVPLEQEALRVEQNFKRSVKRYFFYFLGSLIVLCKHFSFFYALVWMLRIPFCVGYEISKRAGKL